MNNSASVFLTIAALAILVGGTLIYGEIRESNRIAREREARIKAHYDQANLTEAQKIKIIDEAIQRQRRERE